MNKRTNLLMICIIFALAGGSIHGMQSDWQAYNTRVTNLQRELSQLRLGNLNTEAARTRIQEIMNEANDIASGNAGLFNLQLSRRAQSLAQAAERALNPRMETNTARVLNFNDTNDITESGNNFDDADEIFEMEL